jgi:hypothetical protein
MRLSAQGEWDGELRSAGAYHPVLRSDDPAAALTRNRLDAADTRDEVSPGYANHAPRTLQDCFAIDDLTNDPVGDLPRFTQALNVRSWRFDPPRC